MEWSQERRRAQGVGSGGGLAGGGVGGTMARASSRGRGGSNIAIVESSSVASTSTSAGANVAAPPTSWCDFASSVDPGENIRVEPVRATVACGDSHSLAIASTGELYAWGKAYAGRCGIADVTGMPTDDDVPYQPIPRQVVGGNFADKKIIAVASGRWHNLAVVEGGELYAWGAADAGRCGFAETTEMPLDEDDWPYQPVPRLVSARGALEGRKVVAVACGENHSLVVTSTGELLAWGSLHMGRCGFADVYGLPTDEENHPYQPVPRRVVGSPLDGKRVASVACGTFHSLAVTQAGELFAWGSACAGRCGFASVKGLPSVHDGVFYQPVPRQVTDGDLQGCRIVAAACSEGHSYAITYNGDLCAWGNADAGRCGLANVEGMPADPDGPFQPVPKRVSGSYDGSGKVRSVACGSWHSLAVTRDGQLYAWGAARAGRCGFADVAGLPADENGPYQPVPRQVVDGGLHSKKVALVACGSWHSLAATDDGTLYAWGVALMSRCGLDTTGMPIDDLCPYQPTPMPVVAMPRTKLGDAPPVQPRGTAAVSADLRALLEDGQHADVCFEVGGRELRAHVAILVARSEHFRCMFRSGMAECHVDHGADSCVGSAIDGTASAPIRRVRITDCDCGSHAFYQMLLWLYSGSLHDGLTVDELAGVMRLSDVYRLHPLLQDCEKLLSHHVNVENVLSLLQVAITAHASDLEAVCLRFAVDNASAVRRHPSYDDCKDVDVIRRFASVWASELEQVRVSQPLPQASGSGGGGHGVISAGAWAGERREARGPGSIPGGGASGVYTRRSV
eukprot:TRINITY_DN67900_c0_g1_i1.p1 TRINITY_DN67900_c0_g1~~TRINITY_DN67900_c0_g1_i1.p1  ORF type:complete len:794 (-),score=117.94 TRINITY_DN67900_c0_g1_i1:72-2453(-)